MNTQLLQYHFHAQKEDADLLQARRDQLGSEVSSAEAGLETTLAKKGEDGQHNEDWIKEGYDDHNGCYELNALHFDGDLEETKAGLKDAQECQKLCAANPECGTFDFRVKDGTCWQKCAVGVKCPSSQTSPLYSFGGYISGPQYCDGELASGCEDKMDGCEDWSSQGQCQRNHDFMMANCQKACNACPPAPPPTPPSFKEKPLSCTGWPNNDRWAKNQERCYYGNSIEDGYEYVYNSARGTDDAGCGSMAICWCCRREQVTRQHPPGISWHSMDNFVADDEGQIIGVTKGVTITTCEKMCDGNPRCKSFSTCESEEGRTCYFKDKELDGTEPRHADAMCSSHFLGESHYLPSDVTLAHPSDGKLLTFYMYRAMGPPPDYPQENVNTASIGGVLWYLHNECIFTCDGSGFMASGGKFGDRKFGITRIRRFKVTLKATSPLLRKGMNFGVLKSFDSGEATGPHRNGTGWGKDTGYFSEPEWNEYGYNPGCGYLGLFPHVDWPTGLKYPNAIWYSLPGSCPIWGRSSDKKDQNCINEGPGGQCEGPPTGQGNCTYHVEDAGEIDINDLVGITPKWANRGEFCKQCKLEGSNNKNGGCGLDFWNDMWDTKKNEERVQKALEKFHIQYPTMPKESDMTAPFCDFNAHAYGFTTGVAGSQQTIHSQKMAGIKAKATCDRCDIPYDRSRSCQCNFHCIQYNNCCPNYVAKCPPPPPPPPGPDTKDKNTCEMKGCNAAYDASSPCQCNGRCQQFSNCCADYHSKCR
jgi:hypothetical protein